MHNDCSCIWASFGGCLLTGTTKIHKVDVMHVDFRNCACTSICGTLRGKDRGTSTLFHSSHANCNALGRNAIISISASVSPNTTMRAPR